MWVGGAAVGPKRSPPPAAQVPRDGVLCGVAPLLPGAHLGTVQVGSELQVRGLPLAAVGVEGDVPPKGHSRGDRH